jgi:TonB family protein
MTRHTKLLLTLTMGLSALASCATDEAARRADGQEERGEEQGGPRGVHRAEDGSPGARRRSDGPAGMKVENEMGVLETADVEDTLQGHLEDVRACYQRAGKAQQYAGGQVLLRFMVGGDGRVEDVWVVESSLGNYSVERCVVDIGRHVVFDAPSGHRATTFDYPIAFRSTAELPVLDVDGLKIEHDVATFLPQLASCGPVAKQAVAAMIYIEPNGFPGSVGLAAEAALDEEAASCVVQLVRRWKMSASLPGRVLRTSFNIPTYIASAEPLPARHAVSSASARRRRR